MELAGIELHLVDATYELFRAYYAPRPRMRDPGGHDVTAVAGLIWTLLSLVRDEGATHVGCATDRVIRSFRNDLYAGYKTEAGVPQELLDQFGLAERAIEALGFALWPMVELEADDAIATAATRFGGEPEVARIWICTPDKDMAQLVRDDRVVLRDRRRRRTIDEAGVHEHWGVAPEAIPDYLGVVGDAADGFPGIPGWGARSAAAVLAKYVHLEAVPEAPGSWGVDVRNAPTLNASLRQHWDDALLFRHLATLRTDAPLPERDAADLEWRGAKRDAYLALCSEHGLERLADRPHRWQD